ncbi:MAG: histone deacetylase [Methanomassiliicoccales archaeon]
MILYYDPRFLHYSHSPGHPERPERLSLSIEKLRSIDTKVSFSTPEPLTFDEICTVHTRDYVRGISERSIRWVDDETPVHPETYNISALSAGSAGCALAEAQKRALPVLSLSRPPGHHAFPDHGGGFCYFNNAALACELLGNGRTAIVDIDVHHGNGTSAIFYRTDKVLYISTHQDGIYPGTGRVNETGEGQGKGYNVNIPLPSGAGDGSFLKAMEEIILPILRQYNPAEVVVSMGADAHIKDPLATLSLSTRGYLTLLEKLVSFCSRTAFILEGGYSPEALADVVCAAYASFSGISYIPVFGVETDVECRGRRWIEDARKVLSQHWNL